MAQGPDTHLHPGDFVFVLFFKQADWTTAARNERESRIKDNAGDFV